MSSHKDNREPFRLLTKILSFITKVQCELVDNAALMYVIMSVVIELRTLRRMEGRLAHRMVELTRNRCKELIFILGIKDENKFKAGLDRSNTASTNVMVDKISIVQIMEYIFEKTALHILMAFGSFRKRIKRVPLFPAKAES